MQLKREYRSPTCQIEMISKIVCLESISNYKRIIKGEYFIRSATKIYSIEFCQISLKRSVIMPTLMGGCGILRKYSSTMLYNSIIAQKVAIIAENRPK